MDQFVCVRLIQGNALDLTRFQFDYDLTFAIFMMNADGVIYGRYGTRSSRQEAEKDISLEGLSEALSGALVLHRRGKNAERFLTGKQPRPTEFKTPEQYPSLKGKFKPKLDYEGNVARSCLHCHQIRDAERNYFRDSNKAVPDRVLFPYPMPDIVGLHLDPATKATVAKVDADSPAAEAGFAAGDKILTLQKQALLSIADVQWVLHHAGDNDELTAIVRRDGELERLNLRLPKGWRKRNDLTWRTSTWNLRRLATGGLLLEDLPAQDRRKANLADDALALFVRHVGQYGAHAAAKRAGFEKGDIIVSYDGQTKHLSETDFLAYGLQQKKRGQQVPVVVLRGEKRVELMLPMQ